MNDLQTTVDGRRVPGSAGFGAVLTYGFGTAVLVWMVWYLTHLPWLGLAEQAALPAIRFQVPTTSRPLSWADVPCSGVEVPSTPSFVLRRTSPFTRTRKAEGPEW